MYSRRYCRFAMFGSVLAAVFLCTFSAWSDSFAAAGFDAGDRPAPLLVAQADKSKDEQIKVKLYDLELVDQDGRKVKFESDIIGDKVAVIVPFYTTCTTNYPILIFCFTRLQNLLAEKLGKEVVLISVSVDPRTDIPIRLKSFAKRHSAKPGWYFLSGDQKNLGTILWGVGVLFSTNLEEHNHIPITIVGSTKGDWRRLHGFPSPDQVMNQINQILAAHAAS